MAATHFPHNGNLVNLPSGRLVSRFDRSSWITLAIAIIILIYILFPAIVSYTIPSDGWSIESSGKQGEMASAPLFMKTRLVDGPTPLQQNDVLLEVDGHPVGELLLGWSTFHPARPDGWISGQNLTYSILRDSKVLQVNVPLAPLPVSAFFRYALEAWGSPWLAIFVYAFFLPAMVVIGMIVFFLRPRALAAQAMLIISVTFIGQVSYAPFETGSLFYWPLSVPYEFILQPWNVIIFPSILLLTLALPSPKGLLRRHFRLALALIYLPWLVLDWAITIGKSGDLPGLYDAWLVFSLSQSPVIIAAAAALIHSIRTARGVTERAQLKWFIFGFAGFVGIGVFSWVLGSVLYVQGFTTLLNYLGYLFLPLCLGIAIVRYRMFDIDLIIRRSVLYALLSGLLGLIYFGSVLLLRQVLGGVAGESSAAVVISTLLIVALFSPLRRRLQTVIDRRFYRQKYDADQALQEFSGAARREVELGRLTGQLQDVVSKTVQPEAVWIWIRNEPKQRY